MKKLTAVLLAIMVTISACASPSGNSGDVNSGSAGSEANGSRTASEGATREAGAAEFQLEIDEGFVSAEESGEAEAAAQTEETSEEAAAQAEETSELYEEEEALSNLVILEEGEENYRSAADRKKTKATDVMHSPLQAAGRSAEAAANVTQKKNYTVMVYIVGSNLESRYGAATNDIAEMRQAGLDYEKNNLLVYTGGSKRWVSDIPSTSNNVLDLSKDRTEGIVANSEERIVASTEKSADMGIPQTLSEFVNYCTTYYPAEHYGLILWNHGGGPLWGYGSDELFKNDSLLLEELRSAMDATVFGQGQSAQAARLDLPDGRPGEREALEELRRISGGVRGTRARQRLGLYIFEYFERDQ